MSDPEKTPKVPRYSYDLIDQLDADIIAPTLPETLGSWRKMDESELRAAAFMAGQRSLVDLLVSWRTEVEQEVKDALSSDSMADGSDDQEEFPFGKVLGPDGKEHQTVASTYVAARLVPEMPSDRDEPEE